MVEDRFINPRDLQHFRDAADEALRMQAATNGLTDPGAK